jgi:DNA primase
MAIIPPEKVEEIRRRSDILEIATRRTQMKKAGRNWVGLCPFHDEKTPSFSINPESQIFKCFGCGKGGDVITLVMDLEGLSFPEALRSLAEHCGVEITMEAGTAHSGVSREQLFQVNDVALKFYQRLLHDEKMGAQARQYLHERRISIDSAQQFKLGWAPDSWDSLLSELKRKHVSLENAEKIGLIAKRESGGFYDRFRARLMFPIRNSASKTIGFSGRILSGEEKAKYINSIESPIFNKGSNFYGIDLALEGIRKKNRLILCEGNLDVIMLHQYKFTESLAALGTALTENHIRRLMRITSNTFLVFDGDEAGQKAMKRALELFLRMDVQPHCVVLPKGEDPDSFLQKEGPEAMETLISGASTLIAFVVDGTFAGLPSDNEGRTRAVDQLSPILLKIENAVLQNLWFKTVAERAGVSESALRQRILKGRKPFPKSGPAPRSGNVPATGMDDPENRLVRLLINFPRLATHFVEENIETELSNPSLQSLTNTICKLALSSQNNGDFDMASVIGEIRDQELKSLIAGWTMDTGRIEEKDADQAFFDFVSHIRCRKIDTKIKGLEITAKDMLHSGDESRALEIFKKVDDLRRSREAMKNSQSDQRT